MIRNILLEVQFIGGKGSELSVNCILPYHGEDEREETFYGLFVWVHSNYLSRNTPQRNIEQLYMWWLNKYFVRNSFVVVDIDGFCQ